MFPQCIGGCYFLREDVLAATGDLQDGQPLPADTKLVVQLGQTPGTFNVRTEEIGSVSVGRLDSTKMLKTVVWRARHTYIGVRNDPT